MSNYTQFLDTKRIKFTGSGIQVQELDINPMLFPFQRAIVRWGCRKGKACIFAECGLGKTFMQLEWARLVSKNCLILAPLCVSPQTVLEGTKLGIPVNPCRSQADVQPGINIANYEMLDKFDSSAFDAVVLDESSILKSFDGKTRKRLTEAFAETPYRLCCTATPAPNDFIEYGNHSEFLGLMKNQEMRGMFFVNDGVGLGGWRLKGHAHEAFWKWMASWGMFLKRPSDLGFDDAGFDLPPLSISEELVNCEAAPDGRLFADKLHGIHERLSMRRKTLDARVERAANILQGEGQWLVWCGLNDEGRNLYDALEGQGALLIEGQDSRAVKEDAVRMFLSGDARILISKSRIFGFGLNFQNCHQMLFLGLGDSYEQYYQCIRRCWRFGQTEPVDVRIVVADVEDQIVENVKRKEALWERTHIETLAAVRDYEREEIMASEKTETYQTGKGSGDGWQLYLGDCCDTLKILDQDSIDLSVYSPPFLNLYTYTDSPRDIGNSKTAREFEGHFKYAVGELLRVTKPGRITCCHVSQVAAMLSRDGYIGLRDFRGDIIRMFIEAGWIHHGEVVVDKNPQVQAIRSKAKGLLFVQLRKDSSWLRPALCDFVLLFRKPGENATPIHPDITNEEWIQWAHPVWYDIRETDTLSVVEAREEKDERHICPLQLGLIERCIRLWSNKGETVLDPFTGIGSTGHVAIKHERKFTGIELKESYWKAATRNLKAAEALANEQTLFSVAP